MNFFQGNIVLLQERKLQIIGIKQAACVMTIQLLVSIIILTNIGDINVSIALIIASVVSFMLGRYLGGKSLYRIFSIEQYGTFIKYETKDKLVSRVMVNGKEKLVKTDTLWLGV